MMTIYLLIGVGLAVCGIIIACVTENGRAKKRKKKRANEPPPLPPRISVGSSSTVSHVQTERSSRITRPLPPRRSASHVADTAGTAAANGNGPRGVRPAQFPCCPYDKERNVPGERQLIFWSSGENCYRCSRGHRFKSNGKPL